MTTWVRHLACIPLLVALAGCDLLPEPKAKDKDDNKETAVKKAADPAKAIAKPATAKIEKGPIKIELSLKGVFESGEMTELALRPEAWSGFTVLSAVEHGTAVKKGDTLVTLDTEKIDRAISDAKLDRYLGEIALRQAEEELPILERTLPLDLAAMERAKKHADEDLQKFLDVDRPQTVKSVNFQVRSATNNLEYAQEELRQLEKMYRANDIREETEEIILKRQRNQVESALYFLESAQHRRDQALKVDLPRLEQNLRDGAVKTDLALEKARVTLPLSLRQKQLSLQKLRVENERAAEKLRKLEKDRAMMDIKAPVDGIVYYGKCNRGQWSSSSAANKLQRGGSLSADDVFMTIVQSRPLFVRTTVEEKELEHLKAGLEARVVPAMNSDRRIPAKIDQVSAVPLSAGTFEARVSISLGEQDAALMPGMACTVKVVPYAKKDALLVPSAAVFSDDLDEDQRYVYVVKKGGKPEKRTVKVGETAGGKTEILEGVKAGEEVLTDKPRD